MKSKPYVSHANIECDFRTTFTIRSPRSIDNAELSFPHRLLALLLKREFLINYKKSDTDVITKLLFGKELRIQINQTASDKPVFLKATPSRLSLIADQPMSSHALSDYLNICARSAGLISPRGGMYASFYARRRSAANKLDEVQILRPRELSCTTRRGRLFSKPITATKSTVSTSGSSPLARHR